MGKTAVFVLATLQQLEPVAGEVSVVVLCHTRELAYQIQKEYHRFSKYLPDVKTAVFFGGKSVKENIETLKKDQPHIVVGTPGRVLALVRDKHMSLRNVKHFVLDECDKMLEAIGMLLLLLSFWICKHKATKRKIYSRFVGKTRDDLHLHY